MTRKPPGYSWPESTPEQAELLDSFDTYGNNGWSRNPQSETLMPSLLEACAQAGLPIEKIKQAMEGIGYSKNALHQLDRWESKRKTGKFGP